MRILITGSRDWDDAETIYDELTKVIPADVWSEEYRVTIVNGMCPTGADKICYQYAIDFDHKTERHPADWERYGKRAGFMRNAEMVDSGADLCLAFIKNESKGATMTANLAEKSGIETRRFVA